MPKCKLCLEKEADFKGSHIVPHFLLKRIFNIEGKKGRDYELEFVIDGINTQAYYGRNVPREKLDSLFDEVKEGVTEENKDPHVEDYIFCTSCEVLKPSKKFKKGTRPRIAAKCATALKSITS